MSLHCPSAFPIAQVVIDLSIYQKNLLYVLLVLMMKACPYAIPIYIPQEPGQSLQSYKISLGYHIHDDQIEGDAAYNDRMNGIMALLGAIVQTKSTIGAPNPYGIGNGWTWLASILNVRPQAITPFIICSFLETAGYKLWKAYNGNFLKILKYLRSHYLELLPAGSIAARTRLEIYINEFLCHDPPRVQPPEGCDLPP